jgi:hypothetical protein
MRAYEPFLTLSSTVERDPPPFEDNDISYPDAIPRHFIGRFTKPGARVFDPFAGLGTTLFVAEEMKRIPYGIEWDRRRHEWVAGQLEHWTNLVRGDAARAAALGFPQMDFSISSPPYMPASYKANPLCAGNPAQAGYANYLKRLGYIYARVARLLKRNAHLAIHLDNIPGRVFTPLVRDVGLSVSKACAGTLRLENETVIAWKNPRPDWFHTHVLIFRKTG